VTSPGACASAGQLVEGRGELVDVPHSLGGANEAIHPQRSGAIGQGLGGALDALAQGGDPVEVVWRGTGSGE